MPGSKGTVADNAIGGYTATSVYSFTRPANTTAYTGTSGTTLGDLIANSTTAGSVLPLSFDLARGTGKTGIITGAKFLTNSVSAIAAVRLWMFNAQPYVDGGYVADNATMTLTAELARVAEDTYGSFGLIGYYDFSSFQQWSDFSYAEAVAPSELSKPFTCRPNSSLIYGMLECKTAFTPASGQRFTVAINAQLD